MSTSARMEHPCAPASASGGIVATGSVSAWVKVSFTEIAALEGGHFSTSAASALPRWVICPFEGSASGGVELCESWVC